MNTQQRHSLVRATPAQANLDRNAATKGRARAAQTNAQPPTKIVPFDSLTSPPLVLFAATVPALPINWLQSISIAPCCGRSAGMLRWRWDFKKQTGVDANDRFKKKTTVITAFFVEVIHTLTVKPHYWLYSDHIISRPAVRTYRKLLK